MRFHFPYWRDSEDEHRLIRFGMESGSPEAPVPEEDQGPEKEKRTEESREEEQIDPEKIEQEVQHAIDEADSEVKTDWKNLADRYEKAVNSAKAVAADFPDDAEHQELVINMEKTLALLQARAAGEQPQGEAQPGGNPEQKQEQTPEQQAYAKLAERLGVKPEQLEKLKASIAKLTEEDIAKIENLRTEFAKQPEDKREQWLADQLKTAPENVRNIMTEIQALQKPAETAGEQKKEKGSEFKDFAKKFGELIEMIKDLLAECGLIAKTEKSEKAERKTDKAADDALTQEVDTFLKQSAEKPGKPAETKTKLEDFGKQTDKHISDAETDLKESKRQKEGVNTELTTARADKTKLEQEIQSQEGAKPTKEQQAKLEELTAGIQKLEANLVEADKAIKAHEARISALTDLKAKIIIAIGLVPEEKKAEEKPEEKRPDEQPPAESSAKPAAPPAEEKPNREPARENPPERSDAEPSGPPADWKVKQNDRATNEWLNTQKELLNNKTGMRTLSVSHEAALIGSDIKYQEKGVGKPVVTKVNGEEWEVGSYGVNIGMRLVSNSSVSILLPDDMKLNAATLGVYAEKAKQYAASERADAAEMGKGFEVAGSEPMAYVTLADLSDNLTGGIANDTAKQMPQLLSERYNLVQAPGGTIDGSRGDPMQALRTHLQTLTQNGVKNVYLSVLAHGSEGAMHFGDNEIKPRQLTALFKEEQFKNCKFTINAISCYGGGLSEEMAQFKDVQGAERSRVSVFTQTKGDVVNYAAVDRASSDYSTAYNAALAQYLAQGVNGRAGEKLTYGQAHLLADRDAKRGQLTDAEVQTSRAGDTSTRTANIGDPSKFEGMS